MNPFLHRSTKKELLDEPGIEFKDIAQNLKELEFINRFLGGHSITLSGLKKIAHARKNISICEIGSGGGDNLNMIHRYCKANGINARLTGVDINQNCIEFAKKRAAGGIQFICSDYKAVQFAQKPDVIFSALFCHHFAEMELIEMVLWMRENASRGFFINDLQRNPIAYHSIRFLVNSFSRSYLVKNDAPLSVLRSFRREEWKKIFTLAGIDSFDIEWKWAFRYLITHKIVS